MKLSKSYKNELQFVKDWNQKNIKQTTKPDQGKRLEPDYSWRVDLT